MIKRSGEDEEDSKLNLHMLILNPLMIENKKRVRERKEKRKSFFS